jgi:hypothetical protein
MENVNDGNAIFDTIVILMNIAEKTKLSGIDKKSMIMDKLAVLVSPETFERYAPLFIIIIDGLVSISRNDIVLLLNKAKKSPCIKGIFSCV